MKRRFNLPDWIYEDIVTQIYIGNYKNGDKLPTLEVLSEKYSAGRNTIRTVLKKLADNSYISLNLGRLPVVIFDFDNPEHRTRYIENLLGRKKAIEEVFKVLGLLMPDIAMACIRNVSQKELNKYGRTLQQISAGISGMTELDLMHGLLEIYISFLEHGSNPLMLDLFLSLFRYIQLPLTSRDRSFNDYYVSMAIIKLMISRLGTTVMSGNEYLITKTLKQFLQLIDTQSSRHMRKLEKKNKPPAEPSPFFWFVDREQEHLYSELVSSLLRAICIGEYKPGDILPSYSEMIEQYNTSEITVRRAIEILNRLEIAETVNGVGTKVRDLSNLTAETIKRPPLNHYLSLSVMALEIFMNTCRPVVREAFPNISRSQIPKTDAGSSPVLQLEELLDRLYLTIPSGVLHQIYRQLKKTYMWSVFLYFYPEQQPLLTEISRMLSLFCQALETGDCEEAGNILHHLLKVIHGTFKSIIS